MSTCIVKAIISTHGTFRCGFTHVIWKFMVMLSMREGGRERERERERAICVYGAFRYDIAMSMPLIVLRDGKRERKSVCVLAICS